MNATNFKLMRLDKEMSQKDFAAFLGISESTVAAIETGRREVSDHVRAKLARSLDSGKDITSFFQRYKEIERIIPIKT